MPDGWFATQQKLRFSDCDPVGHINNAVYSTLMESGRTEFMLACGIKLPHDPRFAMVIVRLEIDFKQEMTWPGDVLIETAVARLGGKSIHMRQRISAGGTVTATGVSILAAMDRQTRRAIPLDETWHQRFAPWMLPA